MTAKRLSLPSSAAYTAALLRLAGGVNGTAYAGDRLDAVLDAVAWLRAHPETALLLLGTPDDLPPEEGS